MRQNIDVRHLDLERVGYTSHLVDHKTLHPVETRDLHSYVYVRDRKTGSKGYMLRFDKDKVDEAARHISNGVTGLYTDGSNFYIEYCAHGNTTPIMHGDYYGGADYVFSPDEFEKEFEVLKPPVKVLQADTDIIQSAQIEPEM